MKTSVALLAAAAALARADTLEHPALTSDLDYLLDGNANSLPGTTGYYSQWSEGWIPQDCKDIGEGESLSAADFEVYNVSYDDCGDGWVMCHHKDSETDIETLIRTFGQLPVGMRSWVKHVMTIPGPNSAFAIGGNVAFKGTTGGNVDVVLHETGHCLDGGGAYGGAGLSDSQQWEDAYNADTHVPDEYARSSQAENVAQNTVVAVYDLNVDGGFPGIQPDWEAIHNQYALVQDLGGDQLVPGGVCDRHLENSEPVNFGAGNSTAPFKRSRRWATVKPDVSFKGNYKNIVKPVLDLTKKTECSF